jgi:hypothetical protein
VHRIVAPVVAVLALDGGDCGLLLIAIGRKAAEVAGGLPGALILIDAGDVEGRKNVDGLEPAAVNFASRIARGVPSSVLRSKSGVPQDWVLYRVSMIKRSGKVFGVRELINLRVSARASSASCKTCASASVATSSKISRCCSTVYDKSWMACGDLGLPLNYGRLLVRTIGNAGGHLNSRAQ